jgi:hypothetical protein
MLIAIGNRVVAIHDYLLNLGNIPKPIKPPSGMADLPERQVTYKDIFMMGNWDGVSPLPQNFDGVGEEDEQQG